eukprot:g1308.t1
MKPSLPSSIHPGVSTRPWISHEHTKDKEFTKRESKSEVWKERFESLKIFKEKLKDTPSAPVSANSILDSIESDDVGEWINFASSSAGAQILGVNPESRNAKRVIDGKKETFMKTDCKVDQWLIIELSNVANIKVIELTMKELYSPRIAHLVVYGRMLNLPKNPQGYPEKFSGQKWSLLAEIEPENRKGTQRFPFQNKEWIKYLGVQVLKYHGIGTACTINDISVYGISPVNSLESLLETAVQEDHSYEDQQRTKNSTPVTTTTTVKEDSSVTTVQSDVLVEQCYSALFEDVVMESGITDNHGKNNEAHVRSNSVSTFKRMHQDVQTLKGSTSVLSQYIEELQNSLMTTINELWESHAETKTSNNQLNQRLANFQSTLNRLEERVMQFEEKTTSNGKRLKLWMSILGSGVSVVGFFALRSSSCFTTQPWMLVATIYILCSVNFLVAFLNLISVINPTLITELHELEQTILVYWRDVLGI